MLDIKKNFNPKFYNDHFKEEIKKKIFFPHIN